ncbi:DUF6542 domain-containing protein [Allosalinactinospora lopnorensis]|uniref:DUF6542 domain-containing protein n=1 Tax=Allosalinactinospora lopnorensis TaxID=1352348 RepID=UPI000623D248|nr:DUF6542 domain-containing protein [Allosalinactinospora lopnorensis]
MGKAEGPTGSGAPFFVRQAPRRGPAKSARTAPRAGTRTSVRLTGRGGVAAIVLISLLAGLLAHATGLPAINGVAFTAACVLTPLLVRPTDLLSLSVSPPLAYLVAALLVEGLLGLGSGGFARSVAIGVGGRLADIAPWLFLGTALVLIIACFRGLPRNIRDLSDELNGRTAHRRQPPPPSRRP